MFCEGFLGRNAGLCFAGYVPLPLPFPEAFANNSLTSADKAGLGNSVNS
jgi:hypothetical protein